MLVYLDALLGEVFVASGAVLRLPDLDGARVRHLRLSLILRVRTEIFLFFTDLFRGVKKTFFNNKIGLFLAFNSQPKSAPIISVKKKKNASPKRYHPL